MSLFSLFGIAVALAMDALAVSIASGVYLRDVTGRQFFRLSWHFGFFQAMMPVLGWLAGLSVRDAMLAYDHWVAFGLLVFVATGMLREGLSEDEPDRQQKDPTRGWRLVILSVATSIDALAVGLSLSLLKISVWGPAVLIGLTAAGFTVLGLWTGSRAGNIIWIRRYAEIFGALVLFGIGLHILYEHGVFAA